MMNKKKAIITALCLVVAVAAAYFALDALLFQGHEGPSAAGVTPAVGSDTPGGVTKPPVVNPVEEEAVQAKNGEMGDYLKPLAKSGIMFKSWNKLEDIDPEALVRLYGYMNDKGYDGGAISVPADKFELFLYDSFFGDNNALRSKPVFDSAKNEYSAPAESVKADDSFTVINAVDALNTTVVLERYDGGGAAAASAVITTTKRMGGRFSSCEALEGAALKSKIAGEADAGPALSRFLAYTPDDVKSDVMSLASYVNIAGASEALEGFNGTEALSADRLLNFFIHMFTRDNDMMEKAFDGSDGYYHIHSDDVRAVLNKYFDSPSFNPGAVTLPFVIYMKADSQILLPDSVTYAPVYSKYQIESQTVVAEDTVILKGLRYERVDDVTYAEVSRDTLMIKVDANGYRFLSLEREAM